jgi:predicted Zn-dependent protease
LQELNVTLMDPPAGYKDIPEADRKKANGFFDRGKTVADTGNYEYAIEMYLQGLAFDPEATEAHQHVRDLSMRRKATGGKPMGMFDKMKLKAGKEDFRRQMLNAETLLAYDPGNTEHMLAVMTAGQKGGFYDTVLWVGQILFQALASLPKQDLKRWIALKDLYKSIGEYSQAIEALAMARRLKPDDMNLNHELKDLSAQATMKKGNYEAGDFRKSIRDMEGQKKLLDSDKDIRSADVLLAAVEEAERAYKADLTNPGAFNRYIDALQKSEQFEQENLAIELLEQKYKETKQFKYRQRVGQIKISQLSRMERSLREEKDKNPEDAALKKEYETFQRERIKEELGLWQATLTAYPTNNDARFEVGKRLFQLRQLNDAIPVLQQCRNDPKYRVAAGILLGRAFLEAKFPDEAVDTLQAVISEYQLRGDEKSMDLFYWFARAQEDKGDRQAAAKAYSQVAQWNFNFKDVQARIKRLRILEKQ